MTKHTPGPWIVQRPLGPQLVVDRKFEIVAPVDSGHLIVVGEHTGIDCLKEANARLIAAAPELLETLELVREEYRELLRCAPSNEEADEIDSMLTIVNQVIAKATGEQL